MEFNIKTGIRFSTEKTVQPEDTANHYNSGLVEAFATPAMIAMMENTCMQCVQPHLPEGFGTVGFEVSIKHVKATPVGMKVTCNAILTKAEGKKLTFNVKAEDEEGEIGFGKHVRYIIDQKKFMEKFE